MHVLILAPGSRGDVEPAARIAHDLRCEGHRVTLVAHRDYAGIVERAGAGLVPFDVPLEPPEPAGGPAGEQGGPAGRPGASAYLAHLHTYMRAGAQAALHAARLASDSGDPFGAVLTNPISPYGHDLAESLGIPSAEALLQPDQPSRAYPPMTLSRLVDSRVAALLNPGGLGNLSLGGLFARMPSPVTRASAWLRAELGLPRESPAAARRRRLRAGLPVHHGISPAIMPRPADWPDNLSLDGPWWPLDVDWSPDADLRDFLITGGAAADPGAPGAAAEAGVVPDAGSAPVLVSMGSVATGAHPGLREFVRTSRRRIIVQGSGWESILADSAGRVRAVGDVPHARLLPLVSACIHQAGAGITAACLRAGVPAVALPQHTDQFFWAARVRTLGAGVDLVGRQGASPEAIAAAVDHVVGDPGPREAAGRLSRTLAAEAGDGWQHDGGHRSSGHPTGDEPGDRSGGEVCGLPGPVLPSTAGLRAWVAGL
ncbi:glycosyltransferase [Brevibacterium sp. 91QC2O2]|uniref:glycosyltransferase n=1 Tax=Brevibacterium sp. 91QC2O2 TaxID=2968458 RepID=UPI00211BDEE0|nr:glycosyltransferase [Brevibacterium sp. 91QC2O2]MCQ9369240.1 glycosyltransferase [Brevibacterium sp. 91QC2O2]